jgi:hypothetical protein
MLWYSLSLVCVSLVFRIFVEFSSCFVGLSFVYLECK